MKTISILATLLAWCFGATSAVAQFHAAHPNKLQAVAGVHASVFATGLRFPRGIKFGPDGKLYVAESGLGGTTTTVGLCQQDPLFGPFQSGPTSRVSRFDIHGNGSIVVDNLPSGIDIYGETFGAADVAFVGNTLYVLMNGAGCSHGVANMNNGILRIRHDGTWTQINDLSAWMKTMPVANVPEDLDFDGVWWTLQEVNGVLYTNNANTGDFLRVETDGTTTRFIDTSATEGHIVTTGLAWQGAFYIANLGLFPIEPGSSSLYRLLPNGKLQKLFNGLTAVVGIAFRDGQLYALETSTEADFPVPGSGKIVHVSSSGTITDVVTGLTFPTAMTAGPDGALYVSEFGYGDPGFGRVVRVTLP